ncbi:Phosphoenolpyruvate phosphomutase [Rhodospirillales bacterium URHD0017]|nr:Phosphoenolpyruvate phosphomutase [Rhodospirillales bacterium URHD0017]
MAGFRYFINARTDVFFQEATEGQDEAMLAAAIERARAYADAGADGLFVPGLADGAMMARLVRASPLPVNIMVDDRTPGLAVLAEAGVARISHGPRPYLAAMEKLEQLARAAMTSL